MTRRRKQNVLSIFDLTGNMVRPWADAGHHCTIVDIQHPEGSKKVDGIRRVGADLLEWEPDRRYDWVWAFVPCTHLAGSGARWWASKGPEALQEALALVDAARRICGTARRGWFIENPVGRLVRHWRKWDVKWNPYEFAGYLDDPAPEAYSKATCLWTGGEFELPERRPVEPVPMEKNPIWRMGPCPERANLRSATPKGFARAVFEKYGR